MAISDIIIAPATLLTAPVGTALPNANTIQVGGNWPAGWVKVGLTTAPISVNYMQDLIQIEIEQTGLVVRGQTAKEALTVETTLAELTGANLNYLVDGTLTTAAATVSLRGEEVVEAGGSFEVSERAWGFEGLFKQDGSIALPVRFFIYRANAILNGKLEFAKKAPAGLPLQILALWDETKAAGRQLFQFQRVTAKQTDEV
jgi:hypothetical protein